MKVEELKAQLVEREQLAIRTDRAKEQIVGQIILLRELITKLEAEGKDVVPEKKEETK